MSMQMIYYENQIGGGGVKQFFVGSRNQRGHGVGSWLGGLFRCLLPYVKSGVETVGKEAMRTGMHVLHDIADGNASFSDSLHNRLNESRRNLQKKAVNKLEDIMKGSGYKSQRKPRKPQSKKKRRPARIVKDKKVKRLRAKKAKKNSRIKKSKKNKLPRSVEDIFR